MQDDSRTTKLKELFSMMDVKKEGMITVAEIIRVDSELPEGLTADVWVAYMELDFIYGGRVTYAKFCSHFKIAQ